MTKKNKEEKSRTAVVRKKRREKRKSKLYGELDDEFFYNSDDGDDDLDKAKAEAAEKERRWAKIAFASVLAICAIIFAWQRIESRNYVEIDARITDWYSGTLSAPLVANKFGPTGGKLSYASQFAIVEYYFDGTLYEGKVKLSNDTHSKNIKIYCDQYEPWKCRGEKLKYPILDIFVICVLVLFGFIAIRLITASKKTT
jgi:hypothetical protein